MEERIKQLEEENRVLRIKAEKWDKLDAEIGKFYDDFDEDEANDEDYEGGLLDIGEAAAIAFGYL